MRVSVNLSSRQFRSEALFEAVSEALRDEQPFAAAASSSS